MYKTKNLKWKMHKIQIIVIDNFKNDGNKSLNYYVHLLAIESYLIIIINYI